MKKKIKIIIADDHAIVREGLGSLIAAQDDMELVGEARDGQELVAITGIFAPDIILLDLSMPRMDGLAALQALERAAPEARVLVLTSFADDERVFQAIQSGAL
ncbi:MAG: response regulator transcription factor, partial [Anaerolineales bacterium]